MSAALGRAPSPPPEDTVGQDEVSLFIQYFGKYFINASVHGKYLEPLDIVSDVCNCSARCLMTFSFHCIACSMNVRSMFVKFSVCLFAGGFRLELSTCPVADCPCAAQLPHTRAVRRPSLRSGGRRPHVLHQPLLL